MCAKTSPSTTVLPSVPVRPQKDGAVPSWLRTDGTVDNTVHRQLPNCCYECFEHFWACDLSAAGQTWRQIITARLVVCNVLSQSDSHAIRIC